MTGRNMKSDYLNNLKLNVEGSHSSHRERPPKTPRLSETGKRASMTADLNSAGRVGSVQTHNIITDTRSEQRGVCSAIDGRKFERSEGDVCTASSVVVDELLVGRAAGEAQETEHLRELLLLHLDLIHQQQVLLSMKDRRLKAVKSENQTLKCRLERMGRRMSVLKRRRHSEEENDSDMTPRKTDSSYHGNRGVKRKQDTESQCKVSENSHRGGRSGKIHTLSRTHRRTYDTSSRTVKCPDIKEEDEPIDRIKLQKMLGPSEKESEVDGYLCTDIMYYVPPCSEVVEERSPCPAKERQTRIEVPTWRLNPVSRYYKLERTENLEDEVFLKRHQKPEIEERRRKRWDTQRLREQRMYEKLQSGSYSENRRRQEMQKRTTFSSFCPNVGEIRYIQVCETIPVCAFGFAIPNLKPTEFSLPWFNLEKRDKDDKMKDFCEKC